MASILVYILGVFLLVQACFASEYYYIEVKPGTYRATWSSAGGTNPAVRTIRSDIGSVKFIQEHDGKQGYVSGGMRDDLSLDTHWTSLDGAPLWFQVFARSTLEFTVRPYEFLDKQDNEYYLKLSPESHSTFDGTAGHPERIPDGPHRVFFDSDYPFIVRKKSGRVLVPENGQEIPSRWIKLQPRADGATYFFDFVGPGKLEFAWNVPIKE